MSTVAVFLALGGTSYAVARNSVGEKHLKNGAVTSQKVKDGSLTTADLSPGAVGAGLRGPRGVEGPPGPQGPAGGPGPSDAWTVGGAPKGLSTQANVPTLVAKLEDLPAGNYLLSFTGQVADFTHPGEIVSCEIRVNGVALGGASIVTGNGAGSERVGVIGRTVGAKRDATFRTTLECWADQSLNPSPGVSNYELTALKVQNLQ